MIHNIFRQNIKHFKNFCNLKENYRFLIVKKLAKLYQNLDKNIKFKEFYIIEINRTRDRRWIKCYIDFNTTID